VETQRKFIFTYVDTRSTSAVGSYD